MRAILVDWLVDVHKKYRMRPETLFLSVNIIDRYLSLKQVARKRLQLLGVVAMQIAAKFEEIHPPKVSDFAYITDHTYTEREIHNMEATVLNALDFQIAVPTPAHFIGHMQQATTSDGVQRALAQYALELSLLDIRSLRYRSSVLVGGSLVLSNAILGKPPCTEALVDLTGQSESSLLACAEELRGLMEAARTANLRGVRRKYQSEQRFAVSTLRVPGPGVLREPQGACLAA